MIDTMLRSPDKATMTAAMQRFGILVTEVVATEWDKDLQEHVVTETRLVPAKGIHIKWDIPIWKVKPTYDKEGEIVTKGEQDSRFHADMRVLPPATNAVHEESGLPTVEYVLGLWTLQGTDGTPSKNETSKEFYGVELIDSETVASPAHRFL